MTNPVSQIVLKFAGRLRFPYLFMLSAGLFLLDFFVPDPFPFVDEVLLGLLTLLLGSVRKRRKQLTPDAPGSKPRQPRS